MKIHLLTLLLVISLTAPAWARLGETEQELIARYGKELGKEIVAGGGEQISKEIIQFKKSGFDIRIELFNGVSAFERISNALGDALSDQEIKTLLDANAQGHIWSSTGEHKWQRDDGVATAEIEGAHISKVTSKNMVEAEQAAHKAAHTHSLEGF
jgi:hypothetical protein